MAGFTDLVPAAMPYLATENIEATAGSSWEWSYEIRDNAGVLVPWTGCTVSAAMYAVRAGGSPILTFTATLPSDGLVTVTATPTTTEPIAAGTYYHEVELVNGSGRKVKVVGAGDSRVKVKSEVAP